MPWPRSRTAAHGPRCLSGTRSAGICSGAELGRNAGRPRSLRGSGRLQRRGWRVVAAAPDQHPARRQISWPFRPLFRPCSAPVVALVQGASCAPHRQPGALHFVQRVPQRSGGALEQAGVGHIKFVALGLQQFSGVFWLVPRRWASGPHRSSRCEAVFQDSRSIRHGGSARVCT